MKITLGTVLVKFNKWLSRKKIFGDMTYIYFEYFLNLKRFPNLFAPKRLNEKLQLYKKHVKYNNIDFYTMIADKLEVREYVKSTPNLKLIPIIDIISNITNYDFSKLDKPIVIKANHGSGYYDIIKSPKEVSNAEWELKREIYIKWLSEDFYEKSKEPQYKNIKPKLFIEELLLPKDGFDLIDYKFHCINGDVEFIHVASDRTGKTKRNFFSTNWEKLNFYWGPVKKDGTPAREINPNLSKPIALDVMIDISRQLSKEFPYVRVDLYEYQNFIYFGELTLHPGSGYEPFIPDQMDFHFGQKFVLK